MREGKRMRRRILPPCRRFSVDYLCNSKKQQKARDSNAALRKKKEDLEGVRGFEGLHHTVGILSIISSISA